MFGYYLIIILFLGIGTYFNRNNLIRILLLVVFLLVQTAMAFYGFFHLNSGELGGNFYYDSIGILFLFVLSILSYTTVFHSYRYLQNREDNSYTQSVYFTALIILIGAMTCVYLSASIGIMWVVIEATTLSVAVL
ncbi:MAG: hypothetical protein WCL00_15465, partial [Bacteroidota bacterium]